MESSTFKGLLGLVVLSLLVTGCADDTDGSEGKGDRPVISVDKVTALVDEPVRVRVSGLRAGEKVTVTSEAEDSADATWTGRATFTADRTGTVDLSRARPTSGTYRKADRWGLFWSMEPPAGDPDEDSFYPTRDPESERAYTLRLTARAEGRPAARKELTRRLMDEGVTVQAIKPARDKVTGRLYLPPAGMPRRAPVLAFGGSEGGLSMGGDAALLASRGHATLALCYFRCGDGPDSLNDIPMEYFATAARVLGRKSGDGHERMAVLGISRGSESAQHLAQNHPELIRDAVVYGPADQYYMGFPHHERHAWTVKGKPVKPGPIPLDRVRGRVLAIAGGEDTLWKSAPMAESIADRSGKSGRHRALIYPEAGHAAISFPSFPTGTVVFHQVGDVTLPLGGSRAADAQARADSWPRVLEFIGR
ncbi:acyl-CoA thioesterase/bile acid-CoA:amino acid N-acyltransferase family protein [Streptomyces sp. NPDC000594]|uniref:acyl-CoA thioesterase/bile acid-CoA:amino acid N-acyltransferase family protein n=1 Tax=Streptomyces sp. NPDC000594 TaxID=3154261 RepID=UPI00331D9E43